MTWSYKFPADTTLPMNQTRRGTGVAKTLKPGACPDLLATVLRDVPERGQMSVGELCGEAAIVMMLPMDFLTLFWRGESYFLTTLQVLQDIFTYIASTDE